MLEFAVTEMDSVAEKWVEALPARTFHTDFYGEVPITPENIDRMIKNFRNRVRGQEIAVNFDHGEDKAKGNQAAGWFKDFTMKPSSADPKSPALFAQIDWTEDAKKEIKDGKWKYFSLEWEDLWMDNDGNEHADVIVGGAVTNRPIAKNILPINFSEAMVQDVEDLDKVAEHSEKVRNEHKEMEHSEPGTGSPPAPRTDEDGSDDPAIEGGWRRGTPPDQEAPPGPQNPSNIVIDGKAIADAVVQQLRERKEDNKVAENDNGNSDVYELPTKEAQELLRTLDLPVDAKPDKIVEAVKLQFGELSELKQRQDATEQEKVFAEKFPNYWAEHRKLMERDRDNSAKSFAESVKTLRKAEGNGLRTLNQGLSTLALEKVMEVHKKFSEGDVTIEDFEECIKAIMNGGIYEFGEIGSSGEDEVPTFDDSVQGVAGARKAFAELMRKTKIENPDMDDRQILDLVGQKHPDLFAASRAVIAG